MEGKRRINAEKQTMKEKLSYIRKNWQLYLFFLMPALVLTIIFKYLPMGGILMAFEDYNVRLGLFGSEWVGLEYFRRFLSSPDFMSYLLNTLKLSLYGLLFGFPVPIVLALLLNQIRSAGIKKKSCDWENSPPLSVRSDLTARRLKVYISMNRCKSMQIRENICRLRIKYRIVLTRFAPKFKWKAAISNLWN